ncbi:MAG: hypothetical protein U5K54_00800 [Cytophagales bacterium]|nr:hypothetical protein [Cytophagales bacterium]
MRSLLIPRIKIGYKTPPGGGTTDYAVDIYFKAIKEKKFESFLAADTYLPMMYMDDAVKATLDLMEAPAEKVKIRSSYNIGVYEVFCPAQMAAHHQRNTYLEFQLSHINLIFARQLPTHRPNQLTILPHARIGDGSINLDWRR